MSTEYYIVAGTVLLRVHWYSKNYSTIDIDTEHGAEDCGGTCSCQSISAFHIRQCPYNVTWIQVSK